MSEVQNEDIERKAVIFNVQKYNTFDGPGQDSDIFSGMPAQMQVVCESGGP